MECEQCERKFASKYSLNRHKVTKHGEKEMRKTGSNKEMEETRSFRHFDFDINEDIWAVHRRNALNTLKENPEIRKMPKFFQKEFLNREFVNSIYNEWRHHQTFNNDELIKEIREKCKKIMKDDENIDRNEAFQMAVDYRKDFNNEMRYFK